MASSDTTFLDGYLPYLLRRADQMLSAPFYAVLTRYGVARSEWRVLAVLQEYGQLGVVDLAAEALSPQPTVTHALRRLEGRGLVARAPGATDKRQRVASITATGSALTSALIDEAKQLEAEALDGAGDLSDLIGELQQMTATVERRALERAADSGPTDASKQAG